MAKSNIAIALENMEEKNVDEFIFYVLYRMKDKKEKEDNSKVNSKSNKYSILSELAYILDHKSFVNFFSLFAGQTITIPTTDEITDIINALLLYIYKTKDENISEVELCKELNLSSENLPTLYDILDDLSDIIKEYDFSKK